MEGTLFNLIKGIYKQPTGNLTFKGERLNAFPLNIGNEEGISVLITPIRHSNVKFYAVQ